MIKRKRKINKADIISVRRYTIVGGCACSSQAGLRHYLPMGDSVEIVRREYSGCDVYSLKLDLHQSVCYTHII